MGDGIVNAQKRFDELVDRLKKADAWFETASYEDQLKQHDAYHRLLVEIAAAEKEVNHPGLKSEACSLG